MYESQFVKFDLTKKMCNNLIAVSFVRGLCCPGQSNYRRVLEYGDNVHASESVSDVCTLVCASEYEYLCVHYVPASLCVLFEYIRVLIRPISLSFHRPDVGLAL